ncbi:MAG: tyrosine-type recombinase/integrase, partial [Candidatus Methanoperedens sp.]
MLKDLYSSRVINRIRSSKYVDWLETFAFYLEKVTFPLVTSQRYGYCAEHFTNWLVQQNISFFDKSIIDRFIVEHLPVCRCLKPAPKHIITIRMALNHFMKAMILHGKLKIPATPATPIEKELNSYDRYMDETCGLSPGNRFNSLRCIRKFLENIYGCNPVNYQLITCPKIIEFINKRANGLNPSTIGWIASSLRSYLHFLIMKGDCDKRLINSVPTIHRWKLASIPKSIDEKNINRLLASFDLTDRKDLRDYAIVLCFIELGLRINEVAELKLDNINWRQGTLRICHTKTLHERVLPLSRDLGKAIAAYLKYSRPFSKSRNVFLRHIT